MKTFGEFYMSYFGSPYLPHGLSHSDLIMTGDKESIYDRCDYYQKHGEHKWECSNCNEPLEFNEETYSHFEHDDCGTPIYCKVCDILERDYV